MAHASMRPVTRILGIDPGSQRTGVGVIDVDGLRVSDVLQVWLDVGAHPARGQEQADVIRRRVIKPMVEHVHAAAR